MGCSTVTVSGRATRLWCVERIAECVRCCVASLDGRNKRPPAPCTRSQPVMAGPSQIGWPASHKLPEGLLPGRVPPRRLAEGRLEAVRGLDRPQRRTSSLTLRALTLTPFRPRRSLAAIPESTRTLEIVKHHLKPFRQPSGGTRQTRHHVRRPCPTPMSDAHVRRPVRPPADFRMC